MFVFANPLILISRSVTFQPLSCIAHAVLVSILMSLLSVSSLTLLVFRNHHETMHLKIHQRPKDKRYVLGLNSRPFKSIQEMVLYYTKNNLPIRGAEHICLMNGVGRASAIYANVQF